MILFIGSVPTRALIAWAQDRMPYYRSLNEMVVVDLSNVLPGDFGPGWELTIDGVLTIVEDVVLTGHISFFTRENFRHLTISNAATVDLIDISAAFPEITIENNATVNMLSGELHIIHESSPTPAVLIESEAIFNIYGGNVYVDVLTSTWDKGVYVRTGAELNIHTGGRLTILQIHGAETESPLMIEDATVNIAGGELNTRVHSGGAAINLLTNGILNITDDSTVTVRSTVGWCGRDALAIFAGEGSELNIFGGLVEIDGETWGIKSEVGSAITIADGTVDIKSEGIGIELNEGTLTLQGGETTITSEVAIEVLQGIFTIPNGAPILQSNGTMPNPIQGEFSFINVEATTICLPCARIENLEITILSLLGNTQTLNWYKQDGTPIQTQTITTPDTPTSINPRALAQRAEMQATLSLEQLDLPLGTHDFYATITLAGLDSFEYRTERIRVVITDQEIEIIPRPPVEEPPVEQPPVEEEQRPRPPRPPVRPPTRNHTQIILPPGVHPSEIEITSTSSWNYAFILTPAGHYIITISSIEAGLRPTDELVITFPPGVKADDVIIQLASQDLIYEKKIELGTGEVVAVIKPVRRDEDEGMVALL